MNVIESLGTLKFISYIKYQVTYMIFMLIFIVHNRYYLFRLSWWCQRLKMCCGSIQNSTKTKTRQVTGPQVKEAYPISRRINCQKIMVLNILNEDTTKKNEKNNIYKVNNKKLTWLLYKPTSWSNLWYLTGYAFKV